MTDRELTLWSAVYASAWFLNHGVSMRGDW